MTLKEKMAEAKRVTEELLAGKLGPGEKLVWDDEALAQNILEAEAEEDDWNTVEHAQNAAQRCAGCGEEWPCAYESEPR